MALKVGLMVSNVSRLGGGVSQAVLRLAQSLQALGDVSPVVFSVRDAHLAEDTGGLTDIEFVARPRLGPAAFNYMPHLLGDVLARDVDVLHLHGIWQYPSVLGAAWRRRTGRPYVVSPHGMLESWILQHGRLKKALGSWFYERRSLRSASLVHALTEAERHQVLAFEPRARVLVIPNGIDDRRADAQAQDAPAAGDETPYILYLGRIHPKKNIARTIEAWASLQDGRNPRRHRLVIAGWGEADHVAAVERRIAELGPAARVAFIGPAYGAAKARLLQEAHWLVLPSFSEGLPMAVLEAWAAGTPSIMSRYCNLPEGFAENAALECDTPQDSIRAALLRALALPDAAREAMGRAARALADRRFSAAAVAQTWRLTYRSLLDASPPAGIKAMSGGQRA